MQTINDLAQLLMYYISSLYSAESQISISMTKIIGEANHTSLKNALQHHASLTNMQMERLAQIPNLINEKLGRRGDSGFNKLDEQLANKGMKGLLEEVEELLGKDLAVEVKDAAIIAAVQKIEHYEICAYGTALAFAKQLQLHQVASLLSETLEEEYDADDLLTALATAAINKEGLPEGLETAEAGDEEIKSEPPAADADSEQAKVSISERTIHSPGGRAGTSHRRYANGESRGH